MTASTAGMADSVAPRRPRPGRFTGLLFATGSSITAHAMVLFLVPTGVAATLPSTIGAFPMSAIESVHSQARRLGTRAGLAALAALGDPVAGWLHSQPRRGADPYAAYERIRARGPVLRSRTGLVAVVSRDLCDVVLRVPDFGVRDAEGLVDARDAVAIDPQPVLTGSFLEQDPPDHTRLRRAIAPAFRPAVVRSWGPRLETLMHATLDRAEAEADDGITDFAATVAARFPIAVIGEVLGVPVSDADRFAQIGATVGVTLDGVRTHAQARELTAAGHELTELFSHLLDERDTEPRDDVLTSIAVARRDGVASVNDAVAVAGLLLIAGFETTVNLLGNAVAALLEGPGQWAALRDEPARAAAAVEETLRYDPSIQATQRIAHRDTELGGLRVRRNERVLVLTAAANRDPAHYANPATFDPDRTGEPDHLAFASGIHYCIGASLARLEGEVALRALVQRWPRMRIVPGMARHPSSVLRGFARLPVSITG